MQEPKKHSQGLQIGLFFLGLIVGGILESCIALFLSVVIVSGGKDQIGYQIALWAPMIVMAVVAFVALRKKWLELAWLLIGCAAGALGPLLLCSATAYMSAHPS